MNPRKLKCHDKDQRVSIFTRSVVKDGLGQSTITWVPLATLWAKVIALNAREFFSAAQTQQELSIKVRIDYRADIDPTMRLEWRGQGYDITGVLPVGRNDMLELICLQGVKDGR